MTTLALVVGGLTSTGGAAALILGRRRAERGTPEPQPETAPKEKPR